MNIAFFSPSLPYPAEKDGMTIIAFHVLQALAAQHTVTLYCFAAGEEDARPLEALGITVVRCDVATTRGARRMGILRYSAWPFRDWPWHTWRFMSDAMSSYVQKVNDDASTDLVVLHSPFLSGYLPVLTKKRVIVYGIDAMSSWFAQMATVERNGLKRAHLAREAHKAQWVESTWYPKAQRVIVVAEREKEVLLAFSVKSSITVIPNGVDTTQFSPMQQSDGNMVLFSGRLDFPPNVRALEWFTAKVWPSVLQSVPDARFVIAGRNPTPFVRSLASASVQLHENVPSMASELHHADVYVAPLTVATGIQNKILEAFACGLPVVATPQAADGLPDHSDVVTVAPSAESFAAAIIHLLRHPDERTKARQRARFYAEQHTWEQSAAAFVALCREVAT